MNNEYKTCIKCIKCHKPHLRNCFFFFNTEMKFSLMKLTRHFFKLWVLLGKHAGSLYKLYQHALHRRWMVEIKWKKQKTQEIAFETPICLEV